MFQVKHIKQLKSIGMILNLKTKIINMMDGLPILIQN